MNGSKKEEWEQSCKRRGILKREVVPEEWWHKRLESCESCHGDQNWGDRFHGDFYGFLLFGVQCNALLSSHKSFSKNLHHCFWSWISVFSGNMIYDRMCWVRVWHVRHVSICVSPSPLPPADLQFLKGRNHMLSISFYLLWEHLEYGRMNEWMDSKKRRKETRGTWSLALGAHRLCMARGPEAEQVMVGTEMKDGLGEMEQTGRASWRDGCGRRRGWWRCWGF